MNFFWQQIERLNLTAWVFGLFVAHALMYLLLGTRTWLVTALLATGVWAAVLYVLKAWANRMADARERDPK